MRQSCQKHPFQDAGTRLKAHLESRSTDLRNTIEPWVGTAGVWGLSPWAAPMLTLHQPGTTVGEIRKQQLPARGAENRSDLQGRPRGGQLWSKLQGEIHIGRRARKWDTLVGSDKTPHIPGSLKASPTIRRDERWPLLSPHLWGQSHHQKRKLCLGIHWRPRG